MKKLVLLFAASFLILSCNSDDDTNSIDQQRNYKLVKKEVYWENGELASTSKYEYSNGKLYRDIGISLETETSTYEYNGDRLIKVEYSGGGRTEFIYDGDFIVSQLSYENGEQVTTEFIYDSENNMIEEVQYTNGILNCTGSFTYIDGNVSTSSYDCSTGTRYHHYDNKKNPKTLLFNEPVEKIRHTTLNNVISTSSSPNNNSENVIEYTYNPKGYPIKAVDYFGEDIISITKYYYDNL